MTHITTNIYIYIYITESMHNAVTAHYTEVVTDKLKTWYIITLRYITEQHPSLVEKGHSQ